MRMDYLLHYTWQPASGTFWPLPPRGRCDAFAAKAAAQYRGWARTALRMSVSFACNFLLHGMLRVDYYEQGLV